MGDGDGLSCLFVPQDLLELVEDAGPDHFSGCEWQVQMGCGILKRCSDLPWNKIGFLSK